MSYDPNEMMLELFRAEVESHSDSLTDSLLKLEQDPTATSLLEGMMRAAHSIKGAARIVRVDPAAEVAHVMEDCFVAAQRGELVLEPAGIDVLLRCVDLLSQVSKASKDPNVDWSDFIPVVHSTVGQLRSVLNRQPLPVEAIDSSSSTTVELRTLEPKAIDPKAIEPKTVEPKTVEPKTVEPKAVEPKAVAVREEKFFQATALATGQTNRISIPTFLNVHNSDSIRLEILAKLQYKPQHVEVILDLSQTQDLDAVGLALLHSAIQFATNTNRTIAFENVSSDLRPALHAIGVTSKDA
ncbi:MAG: Hpt domain-containing protein [Planctomycetota bacterium]|nr:Hpt domain-containing protein [Planctomycetota bacterium]